MNKSIKTNNNKILAGKERFFGTISDKPYAMRIYRDEPEYSGLLCKSCGHDKSIKCYAYPIHPDRMVGLNFHPEVILYDAAAGEMRYEICAECSTFRRKDFVRIIGERPSIYTVCKYQYQDADIEISEELVEAIELIFWDRDEDICKIAYQIKIGNKDYLARIAKGALTDEEHTEFFEAIAKSEQR